MLGLLWRLVGSVSVAGRLVLLMLRMNLPLVSPPLPLLVVILLVDLSFYRYSLGEVHHKSYILLLKDNYGSYLDSLFHIPGIFPIQLVLPSLTPPSERCDTVHFYVCYYYTFGTIFSSCWLTDVLYVDCYFLHFVA